MQTITPHFWFDKEAKEAAEFYTSLLPDLKVTTITTLHDTPSGECDVVSFELAGQPFMAISAGPLFTFNPSVSFLLNFDPSRDNNARVHLERLWEQLSEGGTALMPIDSYPFSERYGWIQDRYGLVLAAHAHQSRGRRAAFHHSLADVYREHRGSCRGSH